MKNIQSGSIQFNGIEFQTKFGCSLQILRLLLIVCKVTYNTHDLNSLHGVLLMLGQLGLVTTGGV